MIGVCNMNNNNDFKCSKDIYPKSIPLTAGCIENDKDTFLDLGGADDSFFVGNEICR